MSTTRRLLPVYTDFAEARFNAGLSVQALADQAGVHHKVVRRADYTPPTAANALALATALGGRPTDFWPAR